MSLTACPTTRRLRRAGMTVVPSSKVASKQVEVATHADAGVVSRLSKRIVTPTETKQRHPGGRLARIRRP